METKPAMSRMLLRFGIIAVIVLVLVLAVVSVLQRPFVTVVLPDGANNASLTPASGDEDSVSVGVSETTTLRLRSGEYTATYYKDDKAVGISTVKVGKLPKQTVTGSVSEPTNRLNTFMHEHATMVTPLDNGYLYTDSITRAVYYATAASTQNVSDKFLLAQVEVSDSSFTTYNTVVAIQQMKNKSVLVATTGGVFIVRNLSDITMLPASREEIINASGGSYDPSTNHYLALAAGSKSVYDYDLNRPNERPKVIYKAEKSINRITAGGGQALVYYDSVPSLEPSVLQAYAANRQLTPILIDTTNGKKVRQFDDWQGTTQALLSEDGSYVALKRKFAGSMRLEALKGGTSRESVASDTTAISWQGNSLYFGRGKSLWSVTPAESDKLTLVANADATLTYLYVAGDQILAADNSDYVSQLAAADAAPNPMVMALKKLPLRDSNNNYYVGFVANATAVHAVIETQGDLTQGFDDASRAASMRAQYNQALQALKDVASQPGFTASQQEMFITTQYISGGLKPDSGV